MSIATIMKSVIKSTPHISILLLNVLWVYLTLGMRVRKTRRAFEKQLVEQGMTKEDAKRLSACYQDLKDNISVAVKQGITGGFSSMQR
jgi:hypothetical protein